MQVIRAKDRNKSAIGYGNLMHLGFSTVTLAASQANTTVQARIPLITSVKILGVAVVPSGAVAGTCSFNVVSGIAAENGLPVSDQQLIGIFPSATATNGNQLFAADQAITMTADSVQRFYPTVFDSIWPGGSELTLRLVTNGSAAGNLQVHLLVVPVDNTPNTNPSTAFKPSATTL